MSAAASLSWCWRIARAWRAVSGPFERGLTARAAVVAGLVASSVGTVASWGVGFMPSVQGSWFATLGALRPLRVNDVGIVASSALLVLSAVALFFAWLQLGPVARGRDGVRLLRRATILWSLPWFAAFPVMSRDVYSYAAQGRLLHLGQNPYHDVVGELPGWLAQGSDGLWAESSSPYGPLFLLVAGQVQEVSGWRPEFYVPLFRLMAFVGVLLCLWVLPHLAKERFVDAGWLLWVVCANPLFLFSMVASAHNDSIMVALLAAAFLAAARRRVPLALALAAASIAVKPIVILALPFLGLSLAGRGASWPRRFLWWVLTGASVGAVLTLFGAITNLWFGWIPAMAGQGNAAFPFAPFGVLGWLLGGGVGLLTGATAGAAVQGAFYALGKAAAIGAAFWLAFRRPDGSVLKHTGIVLALAVALNPLVQPWYLFWFLPFLGAWRAFHGRWERLLILASGIASIWCLTDQLSLPEWVAAWPIKLSCGAAAMLLLFFCVFLCPAHRRVFDGLWRRPLLDFRPEPLSVGASVLHRGAGQPG